MVAHVLALLMVMYANVLIIGRAQHVLRMSTNVQDFKEQIWAVKMVPSAKTYPVHTCKYYPFLRIFVMLRIFGNSL